MRVAVEGEANGVYKRRIEHVWRKLVPHVNANSSHVTAGEVVRVAVYFHRPDGSEGGRRETGRKAGGQAGRMAR